MRFWLGIALAACGSSSAPHDAAVDVPVLPTILTVSISGTNGSLIHVTSQPAGIDCTTTGPTCAMTFPRDSQVTLSGSSSGNCFTWSWSTCAPGAGSTCTFTLHADTIVTVGCASAVR